MRLLLTLAFCLLPLLCHAQDDKELSQLKKDINGWYAEYIKDFLKNEGKGPTAFVIAKNIATKDLLALLKKAEEESAKSEDLLYFDSDFLLDAQDWANDWTMKVDSVTKENSRLKVKMKSDFGSWPGKGRQVTLLLLKEDGQWKIDDILYEAIDGISSSNRKTLRQMCVGPA